ncbi:MAG: molybdate ABC transporter permease subunit [Thermodesulfobacteriota bacterium]
MDPSIWFSIRLSLQVAFTATGFILVVGIPIAYLLARKDLRGKELIDILFTLPLVLPPTVTGYYLILLFGRRGALGKFLFQWTGWSLMFTWYGAVLASFVVALPLMIKASRAAMESVDRDLINASLTLGRSEWETAWKVVLPLARRGIIAGTVLSFARAMGEFGATLMISGNIPGKTNTLPLSIYTLAGSGEWGKAHLLVLFLTLLSGLFLYLANRFSRKTL